ncbi:hypothetical protein [Paenibacillus methanolicus]|uniref:Uncharacterized protein n=1 Tax=Paenibacillus methanolicus TaxID=582686 RepID=A0A5S5BZ93_9BACL|nr:hypothetical protein [Paenibacillus methanolicus]TYP72377.1 hypothetical protein BCM02_10831 [Paenibacillus methanolicus]
MEEETKQIKNKQPNILFYFMLSIGLIGSLTILLQKIYRWALVDIFTPFFAPFIELFGYLVFIVCSSIVFVYFVVSKPFQRARNGIPILINIVVLILILIVPFTSLTLNLDHRFNKSEREEVIKMVLDGSLKPNVSYNAAIIHLPEKYRKLSKGGGEIVREGRGQDTHILFYTYRGVVDNFAGFIYTVDGKSPDEMLFGDFIQVKKLEKNWYWVSAT